MRASLAEREADARTREAIALRLVSEAQSMLAGARPEGDVRALKQILAAHAIAPTAEGENALLKAVLARHDLDRIVETTTDLSSVAFSPDNVAFSSDGRRIIAASDDGTLRQWDTGTGQPIGDPMTGHRGWVSSVAYSPDGHRIISGGDDGTIRQWDASTGQPVGDPMTGQGAWVSGVAYSPDGRRIISLGASSGGDGTVHVLPVPETWPDALCAKLTRNISHQQWREWVSPDIPYIAICPDLPIPADTSAS